MQGSMEIDDYLAQGGVLTSPANVPAWYRGNLMRLMSSFVDSELAGSAGFAGAINHAPGIKERIAASKITLEKADHAWRVLAIMGEFGTDTALYQTGHDWAARLGRDTDIGTTRRGGDARLSVFHYPITGWVDAVVMNVLMGTATSVQMTELIRVSYAPLAEVFQTIAPKEARHAELGEEGLERIVQTDAGRADALLSFDYWLPRVAATFGTSGSSRFDALKRAGLRHQTNEALLADWQGRVETLRTALKL